MLFAPQEKGQGLVEYALILVLVAVVVIVILALLGPAIGNVFSNIVSNIQRLAGADRRRSPSCPQGYLSTTCPFSPERKTASRKRRPLLLKGAGRPPRG